MRLYLYRSLSIEDTSIPPYCCKETYEMVYQHISKKGVVNLDAYQLDLNTN